MNRIIKFLRKIEWSIGNGQCPECNGCKPGFDHPDSPLQRRQGHKTPCLLKDALIEAGAEVVLDHQPKLTKKGRKARERWDQRTYTILGAHREEE